MSLVQKKVEKKTDDSLNSCRLHRFFTRLNILIIADLENCRETKTMMIFMKKLSIYE